MRYPGLVECSGLTRYPDLMRFPKLEISLQMRLLAGSLKGEFMFGNGGYWMFLTSLDLSYNKDKEYVLKEMSVQPGIIDILREPPVSAG